MMPLSAFNVLRSRIAQVTLALLAGGGAAAWAAEPASVPYPKGYRNWTHVKSMVIQPGHPLHEAFGGIHHVYANPTAMKGYRTGKFADGSVIVFDLLEARTGDNAVQEGPRKVVGVMRKDARRHAATGGWGYEGFKGDSAVDRAVGAQAATACHACHESQKAKGYVFSAWRP